jgi:hypothetical protein
VPEVEIRFCMNEGEISTLVCVLLFGPLHS